MMIATRDVLAAARETPIEGAVHPDTEPVPGAGHAAAEGHRALIFSQWTNDRFGAARIAAGLARFRPLVYSGALSAEERDAVLRAATRHKLQAPAVAELVAVGEAFESSSLGATAGYAVGALRHRCPHPGGDGRSGAETGCGHEGRRHYPEPISPVVSHPHLRCHLPDRSIMPWENETVMKTLCIRVDT